MGFVKSLSSFLYVSEHARGKTTVSQLQRARWYRRLGVVLGLLVPLVVGYANLAPAIWCYGRIAQKQVVAASEDTRGATPAPAPEELSGTVDPCQYVVGFKTYSEWLQDEVWFGPRANFVLLGAIAIGLSLLHAGYLWFLLSLLLFEPLVDRIRGVDFALPATLAVAYLLVGVSVTLKMFGSPFGEFVQKAYLLVLVLLYAAWWYRDSKELGSLNPKTSLAPQYVNSLAEIRRIWRRIDVIQIIVALAVFLWLVLDRSHSRAMLVAAAHAKDAVVAIAFLGYIIILNALRKHDIPNELQLFPPYASSFSTKTFPRRLVDHAKTGDWSVLDIGCADGARTHEMVQGFIGPQRTSGRVVGADEGAYWATSFGNRVVDAEFMTFLELEKDHIRPDVIVVSHFPLFVPSEFRRLKGLLQKRLQPGDNQYVVFRGPAPGSMLFEAFDRAAARDLLFPPQPAHLWDRVYVQELCSSLSLQPISCDPSCGRPYLYLPQDYPLKPEAVAAAINWLSFLSSPDQGAFAGRWLDTWSEIHKAAGARNVVESDLIYVARTTRVANQKAT